ncbi:MAG: hypothetical protein QF903_04795 [Planctomycetota bacterium]|nr:hypothetical protein [Planctomycetota bacterium]MDP6763345.1 hypothetical protein [Planctomycetota bacterium]MDP6988774.1 hypothetical protein [Planctomycetota bacterium]
MDFLLECIGFPPGTDERALAELVHERGEAAPWRGPGGVHRRLPLAGGLELRLDGETDAAPLSLLPFFRVPHRLRVAVASIGTATDSPYDAVLTGVANPPPPQGELAEAEPGSFPFASWLTDARRLPSSVRPGQVLAVSSAGFALDVAYVGPNDGGDDPRVLERPRGARIRLARDPHDDPACARAARFLDGTDGAVEGCVELSARVRTLRHLTNPLTDRAVALLEVDAPGRPLQLFVSPWQLAAESLPAPRPGWRIEGAFLFQGRVAGGLPGPSSRARRVFG